MFTAKSRGVTLIELIITIVVVGIAAAAILTVQTRAISMSADPQSRKQALALAEGLLEEISLAKMTFCDPNDPVADSAASPAACALPEAAGQEAGGVGRPFDNVSDYVNAFNTPLVYATDAAGVGYPTGYTVSVTISPDANLGPAGLLITPADGTPANLNVLKISISVTYRGGAESVVLDGYRTRYAPNSLP